MIETAYIRVRAALNGSDLESWSWNCILRLHVEDVIHGFVYRVSVHNYRYINIWVPFMIFLKPVCKLATLMLDLFFTQLFCKSSCVYGPLYILMQTCFLILVVCILFSCDTLHLYKIIEAHCPL